MNETLPTIDATPETTPETTPDTNAGVAAPASRTPLADALGQGAAAGNLAELRGASTVAAFGGLADELRALTSGVGVFDLGGRVRLRIAGADRVRWLNGMVTNTVKALAAGSHNYSFVLNAQGRIQGDATVFAFADHLILETDRTQAERLHAHLDRFIIMDEVELAPVPAATPGETTLGLAGPEATRVLATLGLPVPEPGTYAAAGEISEITVVAEHSPGVPRYSLWIAAAEVLPLWQRLLGAGAVPAGALACEALRVGEALPLYGADMSDRTLPQETGQAHALNFNKGCYLGQEIVERIRSQAKVHRGIRLFALHGGAPAAGTPLGSEGKAAGELTSVSALLPGDLRLALATVRLDVVESLAEGRASLTYPGGQASATAAPLAWETVLPPA